MTGNQKQGASSTQRSCLSRVETQFIRIRLPLFDDLQVMEARGPGRDFARRAVSRSKAPIDASGCTGLRELLTERL